MRRLLLTSSFPPRVGGLEGFLAEVALALAPEVDVVAPATEGDASPLPGVRVHRYRAAPPRMGSLTSLRRIGASLGSLDGSAFGVFRPDRLGCAMLVNRNALRHAAAQAAALPSDARGPSIVYAGSVRPSAVLAALIERRTGTPYVVFAHGMEILEPMRRPHHRALVGELFARAARVAAVSEYTASLVASLGVDRARIVITPPGIDLGPFEVCADAGAVRRRYAIHGSPVLLTHGRLDPRKGHDVLVDALPAIARRYPEVRYVISGTGPFEPTIRARARERGVSDHVVFTGYVPEHALGALLSACDVFAMPSRRVGVSVEGFGIVALEAAAAARPVVACRSGGVGDAVVDRETGLLVEPSSPEALASAILGLLDDPLRARRMGEAGRARVRRSFDRRAFAGRILSLEREVLERRTPPAGVTP